MRPLADPDFNPALPLQTRRGTKQALRVGDTKVSEMIRNGELDVVDFDGAVRVTTASIFRKIEQSKRKQIA